MRTPAGGRRGARAAVGVLAGVVLLVAAGVLLAGVRGGGAQAGDGDGDDPLVGPAYYANPAAVCELFDPAELELALGHPYAAGIEAPIDLPALYAMPGMVRCLHSSSLAGGSGGWVATGVNYAYAEQTFERTLEFRAARDIDTRAVDGLGDRAVFSGGDLLILVDDKLLGLHLAIETPNETDRWVHTRRLAEKAIERLR